MVFRKLHKCNYKVIGISYPTKTVLGLPEDNIMEVDIICPKCGKIGIVCTDKKFSDMVIKQSRKGSNFSVPYFIWSKVIKKSNLVWNNIGLNINTK